MHTRTATIEALERAWAEAETSRDVETLDALAVDDFVLVGPLGFVLDKQQWLARYREGGGLVTHSLSFEDPETRLYGDAAVTVGRHVQTAEYGGRAVDGEFRATHVAVRDGGRWRLAGIQLSPIGGPPRFAGAAAEGAEQGTGR